MSIQKVIHYCWFSNERKSPLIKKCIKSWEKVLPDYTIRFWGGESFDFKSVPYVWEAYQRRKWAFVADYVRLYALFTEGGIYLDSDVEVIRPLDDLLGNSFFSALEPSNYNSSIVAQIEPAIMGAEKEHPFIRDCLYAYNDIHFINDEGVNNYYGIPLIMTDIAIKYGFDGSDTEHHIEPYGMGLYPTKQFSFADNLSLSYAIHHYNGGWIDRGKFYFFCKQYGLTGIYKNIESLRKILRL